MTILTIRVCKELTVTILTIRVCKELKLNCSLLLIYWNGSWFLVLGSWFLVLGSWLIKCIYFIYRVFDYKTQSVFDVYVQCSESRHITCVCLSHFVMSSYILSYTKFQIDFSLCSIWPQNISLECPPHELSIIYSKISWIFRIKCFG